MKLFTRISALAFLVTVASSSVFASSSKVVVSKDIKWGYLNPLRGNLSPGAADLWGNRTTSVATGMLVRFNKGFESPPHIHNITYRGVVIDGLLHNSAPEAEKMWMPTGSFWTQPAGEVHTTAANGETNLIYLEIDSGPYLVQPSKEKFDNGERPLNLHKNNIVWLDNNDLHEIKAEDVESAYVWGDTSAMGGSMVKLPAGFEGDLTTQATEFRAVVISGAVDYGSKDVKGFQQLTPSSYFESEGRFTHKLVNKSDTETIIYIRTNERYQVN